MTVHADIAGNFEAPTWTARVSARLRRADFFDGLAIALMIGALISGVVTYFALAGLGPAGPSARRTIILVNIDLLIVLGLAILVARRLLRLWREHRARTVGSRLHIRLVTLFGFIAMMPTVLIAVFSILFFAFGVENWFGLRVKTAVTESREIARAYLSEHNNSISADALATANDINNQWAQISLNPDRLNTFLATQAAYRNLSEAVIFREADSQVVAKAGYTFSLALEPIPLPTMAQANTGSVAVVVGADNTRVRALVKLNIFPTHYLYVGRFVDAKVLDRLNRTESAVAEYERLEGERTNLQTSFVLLFGVVALLLLLISTWFGLSLATRLARPIVDLIGAAERVRSGDLSVRVREDQASDEVAYLGRAFNRMTERLSEQQTALKDTNAQLDERRRFTETVLAGVSAGVIGLDLNGNIELPNRSASTLLGLDLTKAVGMPLGAAVPAFAPLLRELAESSQRVVQHEVLVTEDGQQKTFIARLAAEPSADGTGGYVVTFDDITALQAAQRKAAWADVARRIAHEIKNPLTPIQLSAERLKRKYSSKLDDETGLFAQCTDTIIRHVGDIGHMVDEFSAFARMPAAILRPADLMSVVREAVMLQRAAFPHIAFTLDAPARLRIKCDTRQIGQALTNVLKNAVEAVDARYGASSSAENAGKVHVRVDETAGEIALHVIDNGIGLPQEERERLTEPYVTTRAKGTGLGLAIVKKILEDHGGLLTLADAPGSDGVAANGAMITLHLPQTLAIVAEQELQTVRAGE